MYDFSVPFKMAANNPEFRVLLKLLVDEKKNKVIAAEANRDFVDVFIQFSHIPNWNNNQINQWFISFYLYEQFILKC